MNAWRVVELLGVLAEDCRYGIVVMLVQAGENGLSQGRLAARSGQSEARLKRHLAKLAQAKLIRRNHRRRGVIWKVDERQIGAFVETLTARLKPQTLPADDRLVDIAVPTAFRSLASRLAAVAPAGPSKPAATPAPQPGPRRPRPVKAPAAVATAATTRSVTASPTEPAGAAKPAVATAQRPRRHPVRLSDAIASSTR